MTTLIPHAAARGVACPQCGEPTPADDFAEGVCPDCRVANQRLLDEYNAEHDRWQEMTDAERDRAIGEAIRRAT